MVTEEKGALWTEQNLREKKEKEDHVRRTDQGFSDRKY